MLFPDREPGGSAPLLNASCPWASSKADLDKLYQCPDTSAVTTRTTTLRGFPDDPSKHQVVFFGDGASSTANSFGYSPHTLSTYLTWLRSLLTSNPNYSKKLTIVSITGTLDETNEMLLALQAFANDMMMRVGAEFNASCPNIPGKAPPAYDEAQLIDTARLLARHASPNLLVGIKLPPYTHDGQFESVKRALVSAKAARVSDFDGRHPISWLTATNTLGSGVVFAEQVTNVARDPVSQKLDPSASKDVFALPGAVGGLAGQAIHQLALGNVFKLRKLLDSVEHSLCLHTIEIIGVGGVHDKAGVDRMASAGASAVACASGLGREGTQVFANMAGTSVLATKVRRALSEVKSRL